MSDISSNFSDESLGTPGLTIAQQQEIAAIQSQAALQHMMENNPISTPPECTSLYVGGLDRNVTEKMLYEHFTKVYKIRICRDHVTNANLGYGYLNFSTPEDCQYTLNHLNYSTILGKTCRLMMSQRNPNKRVAETKSNIFIKNLDGSITTKALYDTFSQWGHVVSCKIAETPNGQSKGYGFVNYDNVAAAERAIEAADGMYLYDREIHVGHYVPKAERENLEEFSKQQQKFTNIYVKNITAEVKDADLREAFKVYGPVSSVLIQRDEHGHSKGFGFVNFEHPEDAEKAVQGLHDVDFHGKRLFVSRAQKKSEREDELRRHHEASRADKKYHGVNLYVKNLAENVTDDLLKQEFSNYGLITSAKVMKDEKTGLSKGFGFVCFSTPEEAALAVNEMNGRLVSSKPIYVALAQRKEDRRNYLEALSQKSPTPTRASHNNTNNNNMNNNNNNTDSPKLHQVISPIDDITKIPNEITMATIEQYSPDAQQQILGERIYHVVHKDHPEDAGKITGMLLEMEIPLLVHLVNHPDQLSIKTKESVEYLKQQTD